MLIKKIMAAIYIKDNGYYLPKRSIQSVFGIFKLRITCKYKWKKSLVVAAEANFLLVSAGYMVTFFIAYFTKLYIL